MSKMTEGLYAEDGQHPNKTGSRLAAKTIAAVIKADSEHFRRICH